MENRLNNRLLEFEGEFPEEKEHDNKNLNNIKVRTSYAGGFRMLKKPENSQNELTDSKFRNSPLKFSPKNDYQHQNIKTLKEEIEELKQKSSDLNKKTKKIKKNINDDDYSNLSHIEEHQHIENIQNLEELEHLKEKGAKKLLKIEAEYLRKKREDQIVQNQKVSVKKVENASTQVKKMPKKSIKVDEVQKKFQQQLSSYISSKKNKKTENTSKNFQQEEIKIQKIDNLTEKNLMLR